MKLNPVLPELLPLSGRVLEWSLCSSIIPSSPLWSQNKFHLWSSQSWSYYVLPLSVTWQVMGGPDHDISRPHHPGHLFPPIITTLPLSLHPAPVPRWPFLNLPLCWGGRGLSHHKPSNILTWSFLCTELCLSTIFMSKPWPSTWLYLKTWLLGSN